MVATRRKLAAPRLSNLQLWGLVAVAAVVLALAGGKLLALLGVAPAVVVWVMRIMSGIRFARAVKRGIRPSAAISRKEAAEILGVKRNASAEEIERAYQRLAKKLHPDGGGNEWQFRKLRQAYEVLKRPLK